jgi:hypothetical protein
VLRVAGSRRTRLTERQAEHLDTAGDLLRRLHGPGCPAADPTLAATTCSCRLRDVVPALCDALADSRDAGRTEQLTHDDRRNLAAVLGYELGMGDATSEAALELTNVRKLLADRGIPEANTRTGELRPTVAMVEDALLG